MTILTCIKEDNDSRVALTPQSAKQFFDMGFTLQMEKGSGELSGYPDTQYEGVIIDADREKLLQNADIILTIKGLKKKYEGMVLGIRVQNGLSLDQLPRITRAQTMDVLSSQSNLAGYRAVLEGAYSLQSSFPLMMTAAGTLKPARVLILGAGVAGLQAIATAKRLGAIVSAFDVRSSVKEQVQSLGATFIEVSAEESGDGIGGYAQEMSESYKKAQIQKLQEVIKDQDLVITTALIPGKPAPVLITRSMVSQMKSGSVIVDLAGEAGGNCELSSWGNTFSTPDNIKIICPYNILNAIARDASALYAKNLYHFIKALYNVQEKKWHEDDVLFQACRIEHD